MTDLNPNTISSDANCIKMKGLVEINNGNNIIKAENKFVQTMLAWLANVCSISGTGTGSSGGTGSWSVSTNAWDIFIGSGGGITNYNTTVLTSPIGTSPGTPPNHKSGATSNPENGVFLTQFTATWDIGSISGTISEMALYLSVLGTIQPFGFFKTTFPAVIETKKLVSRLSVADEDFSPAFGINAANPLSIVWTIRFSF